MAAPDMDVIKEIPGYKVILKAVLKSQIQQLVEQLASHTDEESVILTASVSDGTLSHLGSDSGKFFLQDHEDIKSQFLGFCLKRHHRKKQEKDREEELQRLQFSPRHMPAQPSRYPPARQGVHPVSLARASPGSHVRSPGARHEPYSVPRPRRSLNQNLSNQSPADSPKTMTLPTNNQVIKIEPQDEGSNQSAGDMNNQRQSEKSSSPPSSPLHGQGSIVKTDNADESSTSATANEASELPFSETQPAEGLGLDSDLSNLISGEQSVKTPTTSSGQTSEIDPDVNVKLESISESDMELEITGVEPGPGSVSSQDTSWAQNTSMGYDSSGATGNQADLQGQEGFSTLSSMKESINGSQLSFDGQPVPDLTCQICHKTFCSPASRRRHMIAHTGEKRFRCGKCKRPFGSKYNMQRHLLTVCSKDWSDQMLSSSQ